MRRIICDYFVVWGGGGWFICFRLCYFIISFASSFYVSISFAKPSEAFLDILGLLFFYYLFMVYPAWEIVLWTVLVLTPVSIFACYSIFLNYYFPMFAFYSSYDWILEKLFRTILLIAFKAKAGIKKDIFQSLLSWGFNKICCID